MKNILPSDIEVALFGHDEIISLIWTGLKIVTIWVERWNNFVTTIIVTTFKCCNNLRKVVTI